MTVFTNILGWLGRQGTRAVAVLVVLGIALPQAGAVLKPYVAEAVFCLLCIAFYRTDMSALRAHVRRPVLVLAATAWTSLAIPVLFGLVCLTLGLDRETPALFLGLMLQAVASPMMAAPAFAALMGLDATLVLMTLVAGTAITPLSAPLFATLFVGGGLTFTPLSLGLKLFAILAGSALLAAVLRRLTGGAVVTRYKAQIDGINILVLYVFVAAVMADVAGSFRSAPGLFAILTLVAFAIFALVLVLTFLAFLWTGRARAAAIAFMAAQRNMGLMLAATGGTLPDLTWLYFAISQVPIYISPQLLKPLARRLIATPGTAKPPGHT